MWWRGSASSRCSHGAVTSCPMAKYNAWRLRARWCCGPTCCCWTSRPARPTGLAIEHRGAGVHVRADMGGVELVAAVTAEAARDLALTPGGAVVFSFKATAVQVF